MDDCTHNWDSDNEARMCLDCGQVRTFPQLGNSRVVWQGRDDERDPQAISPVEKACLAHIAQSRGLKRVAELIGVRWILLRAWIGGYCRKPKAPKAPVEKLRRGRPKQHEKSVPAVVLERFDPGSCLICEGDLFKQDHDDCKPHFINAPGRKIWLCGFCTDGVKKLFDALGIKCQVLAHEILNP